MTIVDEILKSNMYKNLSANLDESELAEYEIEIRRMITPIENIKSVLLEKVSDKDGAEHFVDTLIRAFVEKGRKG